jgi:hypothetical protein
VAVLLPLSGDWLLAVDVLISEFEQETLRTKLHINASDMPE